MNPSGDAFATVVFACVFAYAYMRIDRRYAWMLFVTIFLFSGLTSIWQYVDAWNDKDVPAMLYQAAWVLITPSAVMYGIRRIKESVSP